MTEPAAPVSRAGPGPAAVAYVLGTASGGTALHAGMLAEGCRRAGLAVTAVGPASSRAAFCAGAARLPAPPGTPGPEGASSAADVPGPADLPGPVDGLIRSAGAVAGIAFQVMEISGRPRPGPDAVAVLRLRRVLRQAGPDVVHAHGLRAGALAALALLPGPPRRRPGSRRGQPQARGPVLVVTIHNGPPRGRPARAVYRVLELICARRAAAVLCASADLAARMRRRRAARVAEFDVPAPAAPPPAARAVARARAEIGLPGRPVVLAAGRLAEQKGLDTLLAAAARWQDRQPAPRLAIAGQGPLGADLAATASRTGVDLVLLGQRDDVPALLAAADVVVVPSRWEARALIVQEAMRAGRPIVATRVGGTPALTGEDAAVLVPPGDSGRLAAAVLAVLDDTGLAARLSAAARARSATLPSPADAVRAVLAVYGDLAAGGQVGAGQVPDVGRRS